METNIKPENKESKFLKFIKNNKLSTFLFVLLVVIAIWAFANNMILKSNFKEEKAQIINNYELKIDSLQLASFKLTSKVFTWAIRSEMNRDNLEQVNQFFLNFIKENKVSKIQLIGSESNKIILSTDKKDEGTDIADKQVLESQEQIALTDSISMKFIVPVMGLDKKIATLIIEVKK